jgi:alpha-glucosidase
MEPDLRRRPKHLVGYWKENWMMKRHMTICVLPAVCALLTGLGALADEPGAFSLASPDGKNKISVNIGQNVTWSVARNGQTILQPSRIGLAFKGQKPFGEFGVMKKEENAWDKTWENRLFKWQTVRDNARELTLHLQEKADPRRQLDLVFRACNEGVAFRYGIPAQPGFEKFVLTKDETTLRFPGNPDGWFTQYGGPKTSQEEPFWHASMRSLPASSFIGSPVVAAVGPCWAAVCEADLTDWAGAFFAVDNPRGQPVGSTELSVKLSPRPDGNGLVVSAAPRLSPWRVLILGDKPVDLINNNSIIENLNPPPEGGDAAFDWVKPGATAWDWWVDGNKTLNKSRIMTNILFAAEMGWPYSTIDAPWYDRPVSGKDAREMTHPRDDLDLPACLALAKEKGVGIWLWGYWSTLERDGVDAVFDKYQEWGVKGVKIDFMDRQDQEMVQWYEKVVRSAAKHHIMVNFHGAFKPTGMNRTWPNQITREGILGNEYSKFSNSVTAEHTATLPFTRYLLGPGDFTPGSFNNVHGEAFRQQSPAMEIGTRAHALALCVAFDSPLMTLCDWPEHYSGQPGVEALRALPTVWKETRALDGAIGEFYTVARESHADDWYLAAITVAARSEPVKLSFLGGGAYDATLYIDAPGSDADAKAIAAKTQRVTSGDTLTLGLAREGGAVVIFKKVR